MGIMRTLTINGVTYDVVPVVPATTVTLLASAWEENGDAYSQVVEVPGATAYTKVDLQPTADQLAEFHYKVLGFVAENNNSIITVYAIGDKPEDDHTIQITKTEVEGTGAIRGNTVGTTMPRSNLEQDDPTKADYVLGRDTFLQSAVADALAQAKESGEFNGEDGRSIYCVSQATTWNDDGYLIFDKDKVSADRELKRGDFLISNDNRLCYVIDANNFNVTCEDWGMLKGENGVGIKAITIQEAKRLISFSIGDETYQTEEGMTWAEWCDSEYNVWHDINVNRYEQVIQGGDSYIALNYVAVRGNDAIVEDAEYQSYGLYEE